MIKNMFRAAAQRALLSSYFRRQLGWWGYRIVPSEQLWSPYIRNLRSVLDRYDIQGVIDVGANIGQFGSLLRGIGYKHWIVSFEPVRALFDELSKRAQGDNYWRCYCMALGDENKEKDIIVAEHAVFTSFLPGTEYSIEVFGDDPRPSRTENVLLRRLDEQFPSFRNLSERWMLKLDTQGYDLKVLEGAMSSLPGISVLQTELSVRPIYFGMPSYREVLERLISLEYEISDLAAVNYDRQRRAIEFDCLLVRTGDFMRVA